MTTRARGRPTASRDKLRNNFLYALAEDFAAHGTEAIGYMRVNDPSGYIRAIASLMPKEMDINHQVNPLEHLSDEQIQQLVDATERFLIEHAGEGVDSGQSGEKSAEIISSVH